MFQLLIYLLEDFKLNFKSYDDNFKNTIIKIFETMKSLNIYEDIVSEFTKVLNQPR